jgi:hypothetical protein
MIKSFLTIISFITLLAFTSLSAQKDSPFIGRWDLTVMQDGEDKPCWLEIRLSGNSTLTGRFVYSSGSARPISEVKLKKDKFCFTIPPQWKEGKDLKFEGKMNGEDMEGTMVYVTGKKYPWTAQRAPKLKHTKNPKWGEPIILFNGYDLDGWHADGENHSEAISGILKNPKSLSNLISDEKFNDFKLHIEFRYPEGSNSGIFLRGRYEVQIEDNKGKEPDSHYLGGIYGFLTPNEMVAKDPGVWQSYDITLVGRRVSVVANEIPIITDQIIPGITGDALDNKEAEPGPIMLQGDHGPVEFRNIIITPRVE